MLTSKQAAKHLKISEFYLRNLRQGLHAEEGPKAYKGRSSRGVTYYYALDDLNLWASTHKWKRLRQ